MLKKILKKILLQPFYLLNLFIFLYQKFISSISPQTGAIMRQDMLKNIDSSKNLVEHNDSKFWMYTPNQICTLRYLTFASKEPEILEWFEKYGGGTFYDIGSNIGIYSLYYAKKYQGHVYSFEPSVFNLRQLTKNISINKLEEAITVITNPLSEISGPAVFKSLDQTEGAAFSSFGVDYDSNGDPLGDTTNYTLIGYSLDDLIAQKILHETPSIIKIDVDGIEHLILKGALDILDDKNLKSVYIEVNDEFYEQASEVRKIMERKNFKLTEIFPANKFLKTSVNNQIWVR